MNEEERREEKREREPEGGRSERERPTKSIPKPFLSILSKNVLYPF